MPSIESIISALNSFEPEPHDFQNTSRLYEIFDGFKEIPNRDSVAPAIFDLIERNPDAEFGSPGPLVHELEAIRTYQPLLRESLRRRPTALTVWMVNSILNSELSASDRLVWLSELRAAAVNPMASESAKRGAAHFLQYQAKRDV